MGNYLLQSYLEQSWRAHPEKPALIDDQRQLSYDALQAGSSRLAHSLAAGGVKRQDRVVICMKRSSLTVLAILGVLKADAIYVPVDAKAPLERLLKVVADCGPAALICDAPLLLVIRGLESRLPTVRRLVLFGARDGTGDGADIPCVYWEELPKAHVEPRRYSNIDTDAAYILYTSGSTGSPKGVTVSHLNVMNYIEWAVECFRIESRDRVLGTAPFHFDMSTFDIYTTLKAGATLCVVPERHLLFPGKLLDTIEKEGVTLWKGVSSLLMYLSNTGCLKEDRIPSLERVLFGGEVLPTKHLMNWMSAYPSKRFYNVYGPTETTGISAYHPIEKAPKSANEAIPIGKACANTEIFVLTEDDRPALTGETGELCIRGSGLSLGYWNDEEKTARAFVRNPLGCSQHDRIYRTGDLARMREDGVLEYLGRKDFQVKFMGYRIEIFEVEKAILTLEGVQQAAVLLCDSTRDEVSELVAFIEGCKGADPDAILQELSLSLPSYMLPKQIVSLERIPLNDRGKTDRPALQDYYRRHLLETGEGGAK
jgi:D-alanine--poly(phosphoribitol) ligase subunit 1